jgi:hypothetical protein
MGGRGTRNDHMTSENAFDSTCAFEYYIVGVLIVCSNYSTKPFSYRMSLRLLLCVLTLRVTRAVRVKSKRRSLSPARGPSCEIRTRERGCMASLAFPTWVLSPTTEPAVMLVRLIWNLRLLLLTDVGSASSLIEN